VGHGVVYIDCFDYLMMMNGFNSILDFLKTLTDNASMYSGTLIVLSNKVTMESNQWSILEKEFDKVVEKVV